MSFQIEQQDNYSYTIHPTYGQTCLVHAKDLEEMREHFRRERDTELGRWRHPDHPDYVVYPQAAREDNPRCLVLHEPTGETNLITRRQVTSGVISVSQADIVALAYFAAHEAPKPWHDAAPGEIWLLTFTDQFTDETYTIPAQILTSGKFLPCQHRGHQPCAIPLDSHRIVDAKQLWTPNQNNEDNGYETVLSR